VEAVWSCSSDVFINKTLKWEDHKLASGSVGGVCGVHWLSGISCAVSAICTIGGSSSVGFGAIGAVATICTVGSIGGICSICLCSIGRISW